MSIRASQQMVSIRACWNSLIAVVAAKRPTIAEKVSTVPKALKIVMNVQSEGQPNNIKTTTSREASVTVDGESRESIAGALVTLVPPEEGADLKGNRDGLPPKTVERRFQIPFSFL